MCMKQIKKSIAISGYNKKEYFNRAINYYSEIFSDYDISIAHNNEDSNFLCSLNFSKIKFFNWYPINNGYHGGSIDIINTAIKPLLEENYDIIISIHSDIILYNKKWTDATILYLLTKDFNIAGTKLIWGTKGINTEYFILNNVIPNTKNLFPLKNYSLKTSLNLHAENTFEKNIIDNSLRNNFLELMPQRISYGVFPDLCMLHIHNSVEENIILDKLNLPQYKIQNFL